MSADDARPENFGRRRSLALERSEHAGRLTAHRIGGSRAVLLVVIALSASIATTIATCSAHAEPTPRPATTRIGHGSALADPLSAHVAEAAKRFVIPERWIRAVMQVESTNDVRAVSPKGAIGLMQIMPATWQELRAKHGLGDDPFASRDNILAGTAYLREMLNRFGRKGFLAAYNAGPRRYEQYLATGRPLPLETLDYVAKLMPIIDGTATVPSGTRRSAVHHVARRSPIFAQPGGSGDADRARAKHGSTEHSDSVFMPVGRPDDRPTDSNMISDLTAIAPPSARAFRRFRHGCPNQQRQPVLPPIPGHSAMTSFCGANRAPTGDGVLCAGGGRAAEGTEEERQDKGPRCAARSVGGFARVCECVSRCAGSR